MNDDKACIDVLLRYGADPKILVSVLEISQPFWLIAQLVFIVSFQNDLIKLSSSTPKDVKRESPNGELDFQASRKNVLIHS